MLLQDGANSRFSVQQNRFGLSTLVIKDVQLSDSGKYECRGTNFVNTVTAATELMIIGEQKGTHCEHTLIIINIANRHLLFNESTE